MEAAGAASTLTFGLAGASKSGIITLMKITKCFAGASADDFPSGEAAENFDGTVCMTVGGGAFTTPDGKEHDTEMAIAFASLEAAEEAVEEINALRVECKGLKDPPTSD